MQRIAILYTAPAGIHVPRVIAANPAAAVMLLDHVPGAPRVALIDLFSYEDARQRRAA